MSIETQISLGSCLISLCSLLFSVVAMVLTNWDRLERKMRGQANKVSAWQSLTNDSDTVIVNNVSDSPVYDVVIAFSVPNKGYPFLIPGDDPKRSVFIPVLPPGAYTTSLSSLGLAGMSARPEVEIAFTDVNGRSWIRDGAGKLSRIKTKHMTFFRGKVCVHHTMPQEYMKIPLPCVAGTIVPLKQ